VNADLASQLLRRAHNAADERHASVRTLRNTLLVASTAASALVVTLAVIGAISPSMIPVCSPETCPTGGSKPGAIDLTVAMLFGCLGASLAVITTLATTSAPATAYALNWAQMLLKIPTGALTALVGLLALQSEVVANVAPPTSHAGLLFYAVVFGFSQQAATRLVDHKAQAVLEEARPA
jgi:hypothetical protein